MNEIRLYHVKEIKFKNDKIENHIVLTPRIPETLSPNENSNVKRICVSNSITGCLKSIQAYFNEDNSYYDIFYIDCPVYKIKQPNTHQVHDVYDTGELWITRQSIFNLYGRYRMNIIKKVDEFRLLKFIRIDKDISKLDINNIPKELNFDNQYSFTVPFCY